MVTPTGFDIAERSTVSWGAVIAGGVVAAGLSLFLFALGIGLGLSSISPWSNQGASATTFQVGSGVYLVAVAMLSSTVGGYVAGRMRATWPGVHNDEIYFRDTGHGLITWAVATVLSVAALGLGTTLILNGTAAGLAPATASAAGNMPTDIYVDTLLRADPAPVGVTTTPGGATTSPSGSNDASSRRELGRLMAPALRKGGDVSAADRTYVAKVVAARTGLSQADAEKRVADTVAQAKQATDDARKATAKLMLWIAASMLAGALAAMLGATEGGVYRDSKWYETGWRAQDVRNH